MHATLHGERTLTELDHLRLGKLLGSAAHPDLEALLDLTDLVPSREVAPDIVTMYSRVTTVDTASGRRHQLTLCYPWDANPAAGLLSVLSPAGLGLIGLRRGAVARWSTPAGEEASARVDEILYQPEASGDYTR
jgi:regulator of nucleoside diphosphate kinase